MKKVTPIKKADVVMNGNKRNNKCEQKSNERNSFGPPVPEINDDLLNNE